MARLLQIGLILLLGLTACQEQRNGAASFSKGEHAVFDQQRQTMIEKQISARGIQDKSVLRAMAEVPRHLFVPQAMMPYAYDDRPVPIGQDQTISQPYIVALMTEELQLKGHERVLEIGTGSGYQAAVLSRIVNHVYTIEIIAPLAKNAETLFKKLGYDNITTRHGDGFMGWVEQAPFDAIIITAAPPHIAQLWIDQLKEGGRMILPVGDLYQELVLVEKRGGQVERKRLIPVRFVPMTGKIQKERQ